MLKTSYRHNQDLLEVENIHTCLKPRIYIISSAMFGPHVFGGPSPSSAQRSHLRSWLPNSSRCPGGCAIFQSFKMEYGSLAQNSVMLGGRWGKVCIMASSDPHPRKHFHSEICRDDMEVDAYFWTHSFAYGLHVLTRILTSMLV